MDRLPCDCISEIAKRLSVPDIASLAKVNSNFSRTCKTSSIWAAQTSSIPSDKISLETYKEHHLIPIYYLTEQYFSNIFRPIGFLRHCDLYYEYLSAIRMFSDSIFIITDVQQRYIAAFVITPHETYEHISHYQIFLEGRPLIGWLYTRKKFPEVYSSIKEIRGILCMAEGEDEYLKRFWSKFATDPFLKGVEHTHAPKLHKYSGLPLLSKFNIQIPGVGEVKKYITKKVETGYVLVASFEYTKDGFKKRWIVCVMNHENQVEIHKIAG